VSKTLAFRQVTEEVPGARHPLVWRSTIYWGTLVIVNEWAVTEHLAENAARLKMDMKIQKLMALV